MFENIMKLHQAIILIPLSGKIQLIFTQSIKVIPIAIFQTMNQLKSLATWCLERIQNHGQPVRIFAAYIKKAPSEKLRGLFVNPERLNAYSSRAAACAAASLAIGTRKGEQLT